MSDSTVGLAELLRPVRGRLALAAGLQVVAGLAGIVPFIVLAELSEQRHPRHAGAGGGSGWRARRRPPARWRLPGPGATPPGPPHTRRAAVIRVVLADDQALVRAGFKALLDAQEGIEVVSEAADGEEAVRLARALRPDVVLMDIRMPGLDGLEATKAIAADELVAGVRIVILTTFDLDE
jgi:Response regulator receiver domain